MTNERQHNAFVQRQCLAPFHFNPLFVETFHCIPAKKVNITSLRRWRWRHTERSVFRKKKYILADRVIPFFWTRSTYWRTDTQLSLMHRNYNDTLRATIHDAAQLSSKQYWLANPQYTCTELDGRASSALRSFVRPLISVRMLRAYTRARARTRNMAAIGLVITSARRFTLIVQRPEAKHFNHPG